MPKKEDTQRTHKMKTRSQASKEGNQPKSQVSWGEDDTRRFGKNSPPKNVKIQPRLSEIFKTPQQQRVRGKKEVEVAISPDPRDYHAEARKKYGEENRQKAKQQRAKYLDNSIKKKEKLHQEKAERDKMAEDISAGPYVPSPMGKRK